MKLSTIFEQPIDRPIEGVIKADDEADLRLEVKEYVLTNEVEKRLEKFLAAYTHYEGANGVWVSGFFGSGKSHMLKMLALLLENRRIDGVPMLDLFLPKCEGNEILRGDLKRAVAIPSQSILFNIDQKADVISKTQIDALLAVFVKVFDETCGYYGKQGHIAQFERDLDSRDLFGPFQEAYQEIAGRDWATGREQALLEGPNIARAYAQVTDTPDADAKGILDKYRADYKVSIEDFAEQVQAYIDRQGPDFRLNFFVDEAGQYIADNIKLMTNLQTLAESLATKCRGRAWIIVTAQEDMNTVVGEMGRQQGNDFSKIQARFKNRMKLTSADVAEVIRKRLLKKNEKGIAVLSDVYAEQQNNFGTLFDFADGSQTYHNFRDRDQFIHSYPFIPYQYTLFQAAIQNLSQHNAFEGRHSSVGERSMLGVFQEVAVQIAGHEVGELATFDLMYEGLRTALKSQIQRSILTAEKNLDDVFGVRVLKALFLVKYVKEFKPTARNLSVLMLDRFDTDVPALRKRIEEALGLLEQQTYIQRNGDQYEYLTDEEKDIEQEIKNTEVEGTAVADELSKLVYDYVIKDRKIRHENGQDYPFSRKLDDRLYGREYELSINVISPFHEHSENESILRAQSMGRDELVVLMPPSDLVVRDLLMYKKADKYIRQSISTTQPEATRRILTDKQFQNRERYEGLRKTVESLLSQAMLLVGGQDLDVGGSDAQNRIVTGFHQLLTRTYPNLRMLRGVAYTEQDVGQHLKLSVTLFGEGETGLSEAEQEMLAFVQGNQRSGLRTTMKSLDEHFERKPYGWYLAAVQCILAKLCARGKIEVRRDGTLLEDDELERALRNTQGYANLVLEPQVDFTASQVRRLRDFYADFFDGPPQATEAKALGKETAQAFKSLLEELSRLAEQTRQYPFLAALKQPIAVLKEMAGEPYTFYLTDLPKEEDRLLDLKESVIDPVRAFMSGAQRGIYEEARDFLSTHEPNLHYLVEEDVARMSAVLDDEGCFKGNGMQQMKAHLDDLRAQVTEKVAAERSGAAAALDERRTRLQGMPEFAALTTEQQERLTAPFDALHEELARLNLVAVIRDRLRDFDASLYPRLLQLMTDWAKPEALSVNGGAEPSVDGQTPSRIEYVPVGAVKASFDKAWLADAKDVEQYLESLREALLAAIHEGRRIQV